jgi:cob(I)alamin adenosyltransferase
MVSQLGVSSSHPKTQLPPNRRYLHVIKGSVQVFTSAHRSFFANVMAQALRTAGQGTPVLVVQFLKGGIGQGVNHPVQLSQNLDWYRCDLPRCVDTPHLDPAERDALQQLWQHTQAAVAQGRYALVILDELSLAVNLGLIPEAEVIDLLTTRPPYVDAILTGPEMPDSVLNLADQVTELRRHPYP